RAAETAMAREYEIRLGWKNLEADPGEVVDERFAARDDAFTRLLKPCIVLDGRDCTRDGEAIKGIGIETVLHPLQRLDQGALANGKSDSQSGQGARFGQGLNDEQIIVAGNKRNRALGAEVDISF